MKVLITAGGTREHIDDIRVLTNISTGKLGAKIAEILDYNEHEVHYVYTNGSVIPKNACIPQQPPIVLHEITNVESLMKKMEELVPQMDVVIHAMAVSDFGFKPIKAKLKSNDSQAFIDSLRDRIYTTPKVISFIKKWNPNVKLISFKFEVGQTHKKLIQIAHNSLIRNNSDFVVANDLEEMERWNSHIAYIIDKSKECIKCYGKNDIAKKIGALITNDIWI